MITFIKPKVKKSDDQTNINNFHDDKAIISCQEITCLKQTYVFLVTEFINSNGFSTFRIGLSVHTSVMDCSYIFRWTL